MKKRISDSYTEYVHIVMPADTNGVGRLFGGRLVALIDVVAAVVARRHSNCEVTTVAIDHLHFKSPVYNNDTIVLTGQISYVGKTSMEVRVDTYAEALTGTRVLVNRAYLIMVALDKLEKPVAVPGIILETDEENAEWEAGLRRHHLLKQRRLENY